MSHKRSVFAAIIALTLIAGCTGGSRPSPQRTLSQYVSESFGATSLSDRAKLAALTTGDVKANLQKFTDAEFKKYFIDTKRKFLALKVVDERRLEDGRYSMTYELSYMKKEAKAKDKITSRKHAIFVHQKHNWLISEVQNLKTLVDHETVFEIKANPKTKANF